MNSEINNSKILTCGILLATLLIACNDPNAPDWLKSTGHTETETRTLTGPVHILTVDNNVEITLEPDSAPTVEVTAGANLLPKIKTDYDSATGHLHIRNANHFNWLRSYSRPLRVRLHAGALRDYTHNGYGSITCTDTLRVPTFYLKLYGAADAEIKVVTGTLGIEANGYGNLVASGRAFYSYLFSLKQGGIDAANLHTRYADMAIGADRDSKLSVSDSVHAAIDGYGSAIVYGSPRTGLTRRGEGELRIIP